MSFPDIWLGIMRGFGVTATVSLYALLFAVPFALLFGVGQFLARGVLRLALTTVIEFWRGSAVIIMLFVFYYALPVFGIDLSAMTVSAMVLGLNIGAYASQAVRAGLQSLDRGQVEAGLALGLKRQVILTQIELPQALRAMAPTFVNNLIQLIKATALVSLVTLSDMTFRAKEIAQTEYNPAAIYGALLLAYFAVCYPIAIFGRRLEASSASPKAAKHGL